VHITLDKILAGWPNLAFKYSRFTGYHCCVIVEVDLIAEHFVSPNWFLDCKETKNRMKADVMSIKILSDDLIKAF
jgi:hypothetical protein